MPVHSDNSWAPAFLSGTGRVILPTYLPTYLGGTGRRTLKPPTPNAKLTPPIRLALRAHGSCHPAILSARPASFNNIFKLASLEHAVGSANEMRLGDGVQLWVVSGGADQQARAADRREDGSMRTNADEAPDVNPPLEKKTRRETSLRPPASSEADPASPDAHA
ncbi:hypothetical protein B0H17DRAFT_1140467 [Mycena rosella]|uniref:Uncharacterized protein n=1 Tax=Mycena rosella TaxID=1033263 RepID=A0AAD7D2A8_MYCRO|nr:hypothetical protein B0H17DRAFT_1140467 [Mycena rosella]